MGEITVGWVSELVLWGPVQEPQEPGLLRGAWSGVPTRALGGSFLRTARLLQRLSQRTVFTAESWLEASGSQSCPRHTWGKFQGHRRSRSRNVSWVAAVGSSCSLASRSEGDLLRADRGDVDLDPAAAWESAPGLFFVGDSSEAGLNGGSGGSVDTVAPTCRAEAPPDSIESHTRRWESVLLDRFCRLCGMFYLSLVTACFPLCGAAGSGPKAWNRWNPCCTLHPQSPTPASVPVDGL